MKISTIVCIALLGVSVTASAGLGPVTSQAYEVLLRNFTAPTTVNGAASFRECDDCDSQLVRVSENTRYEVNGEVVRLEQFRRAISQVADREHTVLTVKHHLESDTIELIKLFF